VDELGHSYTYAGVAPRLRSGAYNVEALRPGEWIVEPGLIYCRKSAEVSSLQQKLRRTG
jgi:hypothetical protein